MNPTDWNATMDALSATYTDTNPIETTTIRLGARELDVAVARTPDQWTQGLIGHPEIEGMLFVMPPGSRNEFHMRDVKRDLLIAFFDSDGQLVDLSVLKAEVGHARPSRPYTYALEIGIGTDAVGPDIVADLARGLIV